MVDDVAPATRDRRKFRIGTAADVAWIQEAVTPGDTITCAIPPTFDSYATVEFPVDDDLDGESESGEVWRRHDDALLRLLRRHTGDQAWWLGYLDTGADDIVLPDAPKVHLYSDWEYVLVQAGPDEAATLRRELAGSFWVGRLPNLMFPADRSWLVSSLWDDFWTCVGGSNALVADLLADPDLGGRSRQVVDLTIDVTPPGSRE